MKACAIGASTEMIGLLLDNGAKINTIAKVSIYNMYLYVYVVV